MHNIPWRSWIAVTHSPPVQSMGCNFLPSANLRESNGLSQNWAGVMHDQHFKAETRQEFINKITHWSREKIYQMENEFLSTKSWYDYFIDFSQVPCPEMASMTIKNVRKKNFGSAILIANKVRLRQFPFQWLNIE